MELRMKFGPHAAILLVVFCCGTTSFFYAQSTSAPKQFQIVGIVGHWMLIDREGNPIDPQSGKVVKAVNKEVYLPVGHSVDGNACLASNGGGSLVIEDTISQRSIYVACTEDGGCPHRAQYRCVRNVAVASREPEHQQGLLGVFASAVTAAFQHPDRYRLAVSRGLEPHLTDSVLLQEGDVVDFAPAFADMNSGTYRIRLEPLSGGAPTEVIQLEWSDQNKGDQHKGIVSIPGLKPGLYRLLRLTADGEQAEPETWVLVDGSDRFMKDAEAFQEARDEVGKWPADVDPRVPGRVLRAYLESLSVQSERSR
jgi:hypothetical protein